MLLHRQMIQLSQLDRASVLLTLLHMSFDEDDDEDDEDEDKDDYVVGTLPHANRSSKLHGIVIKDKKKQRGVLRKLGKSMKKLTTSVRGMSSTSSRDFRRGRVRCVRIMVYNMNDTMGLWFDIDGNGSGREE